MRTSRLLVVGASCVLLASGCGGDDDETTAPAAEPTEAAAEPTEAAAEPTEASEATEATEPAEETTAPPETSGAESTAAPAASPLADVCPEHLIVQTNWYPQSEHGAVYQLAGTEGEIDAATASYTGEIAGTGVTIEIRAGGPAIGFQQPTAQLYADLDIDIALLDESSEQVANHLELPTMAVLHPFSRNPQVLMWDPEQFQFETLFDVAEADATVLYFEGSTFMDYLTGAGVVREDQVDASWDGSPSRFVVEQGIVQQGYATNEVYTYEHDIPEWGRPVGFGYIQDAGYVSYSAPVVVRPDFYAEESDCLTLLVPMWQQAQVDFLNDPGPVNQLLIDFADALASFWVLTPGLVQHAVDTMLADGLITNGDNETLGDYSAEQLQEAIDQVIPIFQARNRDVPDSLAADEIATNEFVDPSIGL